MPEVDLALITLLSLFSITTAIALSFALAWYEFDRPRHVATWAWSFALAALMWGIGLVRTIQPQWMCLRTPMLMVVGFAAALNALGFQQRADDGVRPTLLVWLAAGQAALQIILALRGTDRVITLIPVGIFVAACFWLSANSLKEWRTGERAAERVAELGLLAFCAAGIAFALALAANELGLIGFDHNGLTAEIALVLPAVLGGTGLFAIVLLTADLAGRARRLAVTDLLTGLLNRRGLSEAAESLIENARMRRHSVSLALMDLDRFKSINDRFGHVAGDRLLFQIAHLVDTMSSEAIVGRVGGEEFAILLPDVDLASAATRMETLRERIAAFDPGLPDGVRVTASFGLACYAQDSGSRDELQALLHRADAALYRSKADGRNRLTLA
jgi:diguanylate cyclase (GGDEF)-like protein